MKTPCTNKWLFLIGLFACVCSISLFTASYTYVQAQTTGCGNNENCLLQGIKSTAQKAEYDTTKNAEESVVATLGRAVSLAGSLVGVLLIVLIIYGGFLWMTAMGNDKQVEKAKTVITGAIIGLSITVLTYAIVKFTFTIIDQSIAPGGTEQCAQKGDECTNLPCCAGQGTCTNSVIKGNSKYCE